MGQCCDKLNQPEQAEFFFDRALQGNPSNPAFYIAKGCYLATKSRYDEAGQCLEKSIALLGYLPPLVVTYADLLLNQRKTTQAQELLVNADLSHPAIAAINNRVQMEADYLQGITSYYKLIKQKLAGKDKIGWLAESAAFLTSGSAEQDFITRCYHH